MSIVRSTRPLHGETPQLRPYRLRERIGIGAPTKLRAEVSRAVDALVLRCLAKESLLAHGTDPIAVSTSAAAPTSSGCTIFVDHSRSALRGLVAGLVVGIGVITLMASRGTPAPPLTTPPIAITTPAHATVPFATAASLDAGK